MERYVARQNVERYRRLLAEASEEAERRTLRDLLSREEAKLATKLSPGRTPAQG